MILPLPHPAFEWRSTSPRPTLVCPVLERHARHLFSTRAWRLGSSRSPVDDEEGWEEIAAAMNVEPSALGRVRQVHGNSVVIAGRAPRAGGAGRTGGAGHTGEGGRTGQAGSIGKRGPGGPLAEADIVITDDPEYAIAVQGADCVPLVAVDIVNGTVAAAHAGWKGMVARVPGVMVQSLVRESGGRPEDVMVAAGPAIGPCCYQVGPDVRNAFADAGYGSDQLARAFLDRPMEMDRNPSMPSLDCSPRADRWFLDLWTILRDQLEAAGVPREQIFVAELCTASHREHLCSFRRDGQGAGRLAAAIRPRF